MFSGWLGEEGRKVSGFNIPNNPKVSEEVGNDLVYLFIGRMWERTQTQLSPALLKVLRIPCRVWDVVNATKFHEAAHGYRYKGEDERWGIYKDIGRELWATDRAITVS
jgi:hypothetical protein